MKITTNTPELLIVENRPVLIAVILSGFFMVFFAAGLLMLTDGIFWGLLVITLSVGIGGLFIYLFARRVQVVFHRPEGWVELRRKNLLRQTKVRHALSEIDRAEVEQGPSSDGRPTYRVVLIIERGQSAGRHPVTLAYSSGNAHHRAAEAINSWLGAAA